jgi:glycogen synthase
MHIALVSRWFPPHTGFGGVAMHVLYLGRALVEMGHRVTVIAARWSPDVPARHETDGISVHRLLVQHRSWLHRLPLIGSDMRSLLQGRYSTRVMRELMSMPLKDRPDVVEFADVEAEGYAYICQRRRCPVVVRCHTPMFLLHRYYLPQERPWYKPRTERREKYCIRNAEALTAPSHDMAAVIAKECEVPLDRIHVIPNPLDRECFLGNKKTLGPKGNEELPTILHVGRLDRGKGVDILASAIPQVAASLANCLFVFIGDDCPDGTGSTWRNRLEAQLSRQGLARHVMFLGPLGQAALNDWYQKADIAVVPSLIYESFSYTCAQAAAAGLPVVASRIGGIPETIDDGIAGIIVQPGNVSELSSAILRLARDPELRLRLGDAARRKAVREFDASIVAERTLEVYAQAIRPKNGTETERLGMEATATS